MPEVLDRPAPFTDPLKAREAGLRSAELRQQSQQELANLRLILQTKPIEQEQVQQPSQLSQEARVSLSHTRDQLEALDKQLATCEDAKDWDALTRAKERLFRIWAHLSGIPGPGNLKPSQPRQNTRRELPPPTVAQAQPSAPQASPDAGQAGPSNP